jgi:hypothetical protein
MIFTQLSEEIILIILFFLNAEDLLKLMQVSKLLYRLANDDLTWKNILYSKLNLPDEQINRLCRDKRPKEIYKEIIAVGFLYAIDSTNEAVTEIHYVHLKTGKGTLKTKFSGSIKLIKIISTPLFLVLDHALNIHVYDVITFQCHKIIDLNVLNYPRYGRYNLAINELEDGRLVLSHSNYGGYNATAAACLNIYTDEYLQFYSDQSSASSGFEPNPQAVLPDGRVVFRSSHPDIVTIKLPVKNDNFRTKCDFFFGKIGTITCIVVVNNNSLLLGWKDGKITPINLLTNKIIESEVMTVASQSIKNLTIINDDIIIFSSLNVISVWNWRMKNRLAQKLLSHAVEYLEKVPHDSNKIILTTKHEIWLWDWKNEIATQLYVSNQQQLIRSVTSLPAKDKNSNTSKKFYANFFQVNNSKLVEMENKMSKAESAGCFIV